jgi:probable addiction module antidote protein
VEREKIMKKEKKIKLPKGYKIFDASDYLTSEEAITEYLTVASENPDSEAFILALANVAKARGMARVAKKSGLGRESLYKALGKGSHPRFETINSVLHALGVKFAVVAERS